MSASISSALTTTPSPVVPVATVGRRSKSIFTSNPFTTPYHHRCRRHRHHPFLLRVKNESKRTELSPERTMQKSEADKIVDGMDFGELCNEFECISSPLVESTARQLVRDILELREGNRSLGTYAVSVKYKVLSILPAQRNCFSVARMQDDTKLIINGKSYRRNRISDPVRSFSGREKYKRPLWITSALENPSVTVQEMVMLSTSVLSIKWTIRGKPKSFIANVGGDLVVKINSKFTLNQISGQVIEHEEIWDLSASSPLAQSFFWASRRLYATTEAGKDFADLIKNLKSRISTAQENLEIYPDPSGDPTKVSLCLKLS
ncbi:hypothetical protein Patl1_24033 [Pistacia atlantica]|uniref:Uncharacterized protein n=1 Tax=Pistacia atlantica TaxID=434234 RepID=A0ACC0ZZG9_9ROSI|nr:hypothetical protein Patl1_24033 [Pistacia atlantica]